MACWRPSQDPCVRGASKHTEYYLWVLSDRITFHRHKAALRIHDMRSASNFPNNYRAARITEVQVPWLMSRGTVNSIWHQSLTFRIEFDKTVIIWELNLLKPIGYVMHHQFNIQQLYVLPTLFMCFVFIWEQTATCATYSINWLVFITEMKSVYSAVRTGSLNKAVRASSLND